MKDIIKTINYKGFDINIYHDSSPENPFESWDGNYPLMAEFNRHDQDYSKGDIDLYLKYYLTGNQLTRHMGKIFDLIGYSKGEFDSEYPPRDWNKHERQDIIFEKLTDWLTDSIDNRGEFCSAFGIKHYCGSSTGYSQGDYADVFICWTPKFEKDTGVKYKDVTDEDLESTKYLFDSWAWGDVYGYKIEGMDNMSDSCWGFYGDDHKRSGLLEYAKNAINCHIEWVKKEKEKRLKTFIRNRVPFQYRIYG
jgi:hypothetical protein